MKTAARAFALLILLLFTDRTARASGVASSVSLAGGLTVDRAHQWIAFYATFVGALGATATLVYVVLKIIRMLRNPSARE